MAQYNGGSALEERLLALQERLGYRFRDSGLLRHALTHRSYLNEVTESVEDNQRLEYLGDAVLDLLIAEQLFRRYPEAREGDLTRWRAQMVSTEALATLALLTGVGDALIIGRGEEASGGQARPANLAAALEALIAAVYLDSGWEGVTGAVLPLFEEEIERVARATGPVDARSRLQESAQSRFGITPRYRTVAEHGPDHDRYFDVEVAVGDLLRARGDGRSKRAAAQIAAEHALAMMEDDSRRGTEDTENVRSDP